MTNETTLIPYARAANERLIINGFLARYPANTRGQYRLILRQFIIWCDEHGVPLLDVQRGHIDLYGRFLDEHRGLKPATIHGYLSCICSMYKHACSDGYIQRDPGVGVRRPTVPPMSSTEGLTRSEAADLLRAAEQHGLLAHALFSLLLQNGLRISECLGIDIEHFGFDRGYRTVFLPHRKGGKIGTLALSVPTAWSVERVMDGRTTGPLLRGRDGTRLKVAAARRLMRKLCVQAGIEGRKHPHSCRHAFVTLALDAGVPERDIMDSTGHESSVMIRYYDRNRGGIERNATHAVSSFIGAAR